VEPEGFLDQFRFYLYQHQLFILAEFPFDDNIDKLVEELLRVLLKPIKMGYY
jgi:hypothetical protein